MAAGSEAPPLVTLAGGFVVPLPALELVWRLEDRGFTIRRDGQELVVCPGRQLTEADRDAIRQHRTAVLAIVDYVEAVQ